MWSVQSFNRPGLSLQSFLISYHKSVSQSVFCGTSTYCVLNTVPPLEDDHGNSNSSHVKIFLPKKLLECLPKCSSLPKERHRWNTNERS
ncbi:calmodulin-binding transcription activator 1-like isoform X1 [Bubalus kerabau]|uniref:calmodulin-binding transcription activator 1-like isoform X1 n=1 Tax=Bubalus carabanensis TaxID=3119969 RepID=UPI00244E958F|nr:calmodulin-binding transcription activator 1-like isoform X1 [Bubalus carabanensis]